MEPTAQDIYQSIVDATARETDIQATVKDLQEKRDLETQEQMRSIFEDIAQRERIAANLKKANAARLAKRLANTSKAGYDATGGSDEKDS